MPPVPAPVTPRSLSVDRHNLVNLKCITLSLSLILLFMLGSFFTYQFIAHRRRAIRDNAFLRTFSLPALLAEGACRVGKRTSFLPTVSTLVAQSTLVASSPLRLSIIPDKFGPPSTLRWSTDFICHGLERSLSWGRATVGLFGLAASASVASIQQLFSGLISLIASPSSTLSNGNDPRPGYATSLRRLCNTRVLGPFAGLLQRLLGSSAKGNAEPRRHPSDLTGPVVDSEPDILVPDAIDAPHILLSTDDPQFKIDTPVIPLIILSLPSSEHLVGDLLPPAPLDEDLLSPDGTFRSTGSLARPMADAYNINDGTRLALAARLRERRKRPKSLSSPSILATSGMVHWPRWL
ncbi:hypothetical protein BJV78DRAFT_553343 [Lactifluus subvellereus]|nr:hypothetical protein BJV78DRAFT_553343 [Lactifluus subvellereus]